MKVMSKLFFYGGALYCQQMPPKIEIEHDIENCIQDECKLNNELNANYGEAYHAGYIDGYNDAFKKFSQTEGL